MFRIPVLVLATVLSSTALWSAFVSGTMSIETALVRFLIAMPVAALMVVAFRRLMASDQTSPLSQRAHAAQVAEPHETSQMS
ncbi:hypothetical protein ACSMXN_19480 [Jatrophihabitans sp. DSM 45814]